MFDVQQYREFATPIELQLRWSDQDTNAHINNARIGTLFEEARIRARDVWRGDGPEPLEGSLLVRAQHTSFDREVLYGPDTTVLVWISRVGNSSYVVSHLLVQDGQPCVHMEVTMVVVDAAGKPRAHGDFFREHLKAHSGPPYAPQPKSSGA